MARYRVKALLEVGYDAEYLGKMASSLEGSENSILTALSKLNFCLLYTSDAADE